MTTIPDIIQHVEEVLATSKELMDEGDSHNVALILNSFLHILIRDLEALDAEQGARNVLLNGLGEEVKPQRAMTHAAPQQPGTPPKPTRVKRAIRNKYAGKCVICGEDQPPGAGFIVPLEQPQGKQKWWTYCPNHYQTEAP